MYNYGQYYTSQYSTNTYDYWERSFFQRLRALIRIEGLPQASPDQIQTDEDAFMWGLFRHGFLAMLKSRRYGITFQPATPAGVGLQFEPTSMTVATPYFNFTRPLLIGVECEVIKLTPDYTGVWDIIHKYAQEMTLQDVAIRQSQYNARFAYAIAVDNDKEKASVQAMFERVENGEPYIIYNSGLKKNVIQQGGEKEVPWAQLDRDLKKNFLLPELLVARRNILADFYKEIGVPMPVDKKERVNVAETNLAEAECYNRRAVWKRCLDESLARCNAMYGTNMRAVVDDFKGGVQDDISKTVNQ